MGRESADSLFTVGIGLNTLAAQTPLEKSEIRLVDVLILVEISSEEPIWIQGQEAVRRRGVRPVSYSWSGATRLENIDILAIDITVFVEVCGHDERKPGHPSFAQTRPG